LFSPLAAQEGGIFVRRQLLEEASQLHLLLRTGRLEAITCPATIMHSLRDDVVPLEAVQRLADELQRSSRAFHLELLPVGGAGWRRAGGGAGWAVREGERERGVGLWEQSSVFMCMPPLSAHQIVHPCCRMATTD
jgi:fermentation-respiration switch protein FrsA (DUF1100 family)